MDHQNETIDRMVTVHRLAEISGVTVRALHHYDRIGLLRPARRNDSGYRLYGRAERMRLQQILFYRELDVPLEEIKRALDDPAHDPVEVFSAHRAALIARKSRITRLVATLDATIREVQGAKEMLSDKQLYEGFTPEQAERYQREAEDAYGAEVVAGVTGKLKKMGRKQWDAVKKEGDDIARAIAEIVDRPVEDTEVQSLVARHHAWLENFWHADAAAYEGLGRQYADHPEFRAHYERIGPGLADYMRDAMAFYARENLA